MSRLLLPIAYPRDVFGGDPELTVEHLTKWAVLSKSWPALSSSLVADTFAVRAVGGRLHIHRGEATDPDATVTTDVASFTAVFTRRRILDDAIAAGELTVTGDAGTLRALLAALPRPA
jgi:hypothetical protein